MLLEALLEILFWLLVESVPAVFRRLGAFIRWLYLRKELSYAEVLKREGNMGVGLSVFVPIFAGYILYLTAA